MITDNINEQNDQIYAEAKSQEKICASMMWKILTAEIREKIYYSL